MYRNLSSKSVFSVISLSSLAVLLGGCLGGGSSGSSGKLTLSITDAPVDEAQHVYVQFSGLEIHGSSMNDITLNFCADPGNANNTVVSTIACTKSKPMQIDLLNLSSGKSETLISGYTLDADHYQWVRLMVDTANQLDSYIVLGDGSTHELTIPSGAETGLKLVRGFDVAAGGNMDFTIDFDLRKSVHTNNGSYLLRPALRLVDNLQVGSVAGSVSPSLLTNCNGPAVYVYAGSDITPVDVNTNLNTNPITSAAVNLTDNTYKAAFLEAGNYTVTFTCAAADDPAATNMLTFSGTSNVTVTANTKTEHNF